MLVKRIHAFIDVAFILMLFLGGKLLLKRSGSGDWQESIFGAPLLSSMLLFFVLPLVFVVLRGRNPGSIGLTIRDLTYHLRVAIRAASFVLPATMLFPVIGLLGSKPTEWLGSSILAAGFLVAGLAFAMHSRRLTNQSAMDLSWAGLLIYIALLTIGLIGSCLLLPIFPIATRLITVLIFVGFLEELLFRGYVQSRLNDCFGKPFRFQNVEFGAGMLLAALLFGVFHPLTAGNGIPWAWALWTTAAGVVFGFLREKTGGVVAPAILHGLILVPSVLFAPAAG